MWGYSTTVFRVRERIRVQVRVGASCVGGTACSFRGLYCNPMDVICKLSIGMFFAFGCVRLSRLRQHETTTIMKVLLTTDCSKSAEQTIRWFSRFPLKHSTSYEILTVSNYHVYGVTPAAVFDETIRQESNHADESFQRASAILKEVGIEGVHVARLGNAADEITYYAQETNVDLIVVGAQRLEGHAMTAGGFCPSLM